MKRFDVDAFLRAGAQLSSWLTAMDQLEKPARLEKRTDLVSLTNRKRAAKALRTLKVDAELAGAKVTCLAIDELLPLVVKKDQIRWNELDRAVGTIQSTLRREVSLCAVYMLPQDSEALLIQNDPLFGSEVATQLPATAYDVEEAGRCFALERYTACVFHNMRVLEITLRAVSRFLKLPDPTRGTDRNWGKMIQAIQGEVTKRDANGGSGWTAKADKSFVNDVIASLDAIRAAWRNTTMHVEARYGREEAEHIMLAVKALARKVAVKIDQEGHPTAP